MGGEEEGHSIKHRQTKIHSTIRIAISDVHIHTHTHIKTQSMVNLSPISSVSAFFGAAAKNLQ